MHYTIDGCTRPIQARGLCSSHYSTWHRKTQLKHQLICAHCGRHTAVSRPGLKYCSAKCSAIVAGRASARASRKPMPVVLYTGPRHAQPPIVWVRTTRRLTSGRCRTCDAWFVSTTADVTCSPDCNVQRQAELKRIQRARRRARKRDAFVENVSPKKVFTRDGYRCHLCGNKTDPTQVVPHPRAPTVDHVIPLDSGGTHEPSNCRCACFRCNCLKGNRGGGEQFLLIA